MNILILHPSPALKRYHSYYHSCEKLNENKHHAVFTYNGPQINDFTGQTSVYWFDGWVADNHKLIENTCIIELEKKYPKSNLWLAAVSERRYTNYSLLDGSYRSIGYKVRDLNYIIKALVLFYQWICDKENIDAILAEHPDNIHSTTLFEMCQSIDPVAFLLFPDFYWDRNHYYLFDSKFFTSSLIAERYQQLMNDYENLVLPRLDKVDSYLAKRINQDPKEHQKKVLPRLNILSNTLNGLDVLTRQTKNIVFKADIVRGYYQLVFSKVIMAYLKRNKNLIQRFFHRSFSTELPDGPFVYFPMQRVPEAAMLVRATAFLNQQAFIQTLSASLPAGFTLVVKDHPRNRGTQPISFYKKILDLPNVMIIHEEFSNAQLLQKNQLLVTIAGTLGFQQLMQGKPVLMFGRKFYEIIEGVIRVDDMNNLPYSLKSILIEHKTPPPELIKRSMAAFILAFTEHRHEASETAEKLHQNPKVLARLIMDMVDKDVSRLIKKREH